MKPRSSARLVRIRDALGMSQRELADEFKVTSGAIAHWESGKRPVPGPVVRLLDLYENELWPGATLSARADGATATSLIPAHPRAVATIALWLAARGALGTADRPVTRRVRLAACRQLVRTLGKRKGVPMKLGQLIGFIDAGLTEPERALFAGIPRTATPMSSAAVVAQFIASFGRTPRQLFADWSPVPLAVGSIGQVHAAVTASGLPVAVKVQPPRTKDALAADLRALALLERPMAIFFPGQQVDPILSELCARLAEESDYAREAEHQRRFAARFAGDIRVPRVIDSATGPFVITSELVRGRSLAEFAARADQDERDRAGAAIWRFYYESLFRHLEFNADPQPGNLVFEPDGRVAFLDFGRVSRLPARLVEQLGRMLRSVLERDRAALRAVLVEMGLVLTAAHFDFEAAYRSLAMAHRMCLVDERFQFTPALNRLIWDLVYARNPNLAAIDYSPEMVLLPQLVFGVNSLLGALGARVSCREILLDLIYPGNARRPPPFSPAELAGLSV